MKNKSKTLKRICLMIGLLLSISFHAFSQTVRITGQVLSSDDNSALQGVTVKIKGQKGGIATDKQGKFSLEVAKDAILLITSTGFTPQEVSTAGKSNITVLLNAANSKLDEVVVVGYGTQTVRNNTTAISKLDNKTLESAPRSNIGQALQGTMPGLQVINTSGTPGAAPKIILRGGASINAPGNPLVIVDGVIREFNDVAPEDIANVQILKDAAATAIYGARANNGVLLISTKQGKQGKAQINYKFTGGFNQNRFGYNYLNAKDYLYYSRLANKNSGRTLSQVNSTRGFGVLTGPADVASFDLRYLPGNEKLLSQGWQQMTDPFDGKSQLIFKDHAGEVADILFRNTYTKEHYISAEGGNEKGKYYASFGYYNEDGIIVGSSYRRFTGNLNASYKLRPNLEVQTGVNLSTASTLGMPATESSALYRTLGIWPTFNPWLDAAKTQPNPGNSASDGNPLYWIQKLSQNNDNNKVTANASLKWDILPELYVKGSANVFLKETLGRSFQYPTQTYANIFANPPSYSSSLRQSTANFSRDFQKTFNIIANYSKTFDNKHDVSAMIGAEGYFMNSFNMYQLGQKGPTDDIVTANASTEFPIGNSGGNSGPFGGSTTTTPTGNGNANSFFGIVSQFARFGYTYDNRYMLTAVVRRDEVSSLPVGKKAGIFPGLSLGWNLNNEAFFKKLSIAKTISTFKPRVSYGVNGNINGLGRYEVQGEYTSQGSYGGAAGFLSTGLINPNLQWERSTTTDIGLDAGFLNDRITFTFDYYNKVTSDLLTNIDLPSYTGYPSFRTNLGSLQNRGFEFSVNGNVLNRNGWTVNIGANAAFVKNKVLKLPFNGNENNRQGGLQVYDASGKSIWVGGIQEGQALGQIYAFKQEGIFKDQAQVDAVAGNRVDEIALISGPNNTKYPNKITPGDVNWKDVNNDGVIDNKDQVYVGNLYPKWTGGFNGSVAYKGFSLYTRWEFALGHTIYNDLVARTMGQYQGTFSYIDMMKNAWTPENTNTDVPKPYYADQVAAPLGKKNYTRINNGNALLNSNNSRFYEKGDYLAIREITLSYTFPKSILDKTKVFSNAKIYVTGNNLGYITKFTGQSPEAPVDGNGNLSGVYTGSFPLARTYVLGVQVSF